MSPRQAARIMQRAIRRRLDRDFGRPSIQDLVKAMVMINAAPAKYAEFPDRLTACLNYALVLHTQVSASGKCRPSRLARGPAFACRHPSSGYTNAMLLRSYLEASHSLCREFAQYFQ